jgi:hypothetical protein
MKNRTQPKSKGTKSSRIIFQLKKKDRFDIGIGEEKA